MPETTKLTIDVAFKDRCNMARKELKSQETRLRGMIHDELYDSEQQFPFQHDEMKANTMLAIRHVEDARMRIGKILQYADDGVSILDKS